MAIIYIMFIIMEVQVMKNKKKLIGSLVISVTFIVFLAVGYYISKPAKNINDKEMFTESAVNTTSETKKINVYVNGEVKKPGVYELESGSRIEDAIKISGGFTETADKTRLNLAKKLRDEDYIFIDTINLRNSNASGSSSSGTGENKVNINTASKEELMTVPGIGEVTAGNIIAYREKNGDFSTIEDLKKVGRIGDKTLEKFKDKIEVR
jgi:competence protein ComEA